MGLFEDIGRKVETFKQQAESHSEERARAKCPECETLVYTDREDCPECGHEPLLVRKSETEDGETEDGETEDGETDESEETEADSEGSGEDRT
mgnify:CR=1 FL=1